MRRLNRLLPLLLCCCCCCCVRAQYDASQAVNTWWYDMTHIGHHRANDNINDNVVVESDVAIRCYDHALVDEQMIDAHRLRPSEALLAQNVYAFRFPVSHLEWLQVVSVDVQSLRWEGTADFCNTTALGHSADSVRLAWGERADVAQFADLPAPCDADSEQDLHYGISLTSNTARSWGSQPRIEHSGKLFLPRGGRQAMDALVSRLNARRDALGTHSSALNDALETGLSAADVAADAGDGRSLLYFSLAIYYRSFSPVRLKELVVRKCLLEQVQPQLLSVMSVTMHPRGDTSAAAAQLLASLQAMPVSLSAMPELPSLVPMRSCVWEEYASGSCFVEVGWVNTGTEAILARNCEEGNCLHPKSVRDYTAMPELFEPGWYRNHTRIAWLCHGILPGEWTPLRWELGTLSVQVDQTTPFCRSSTALGSLQYAESASEVIPFEHYRFDESGLRLWDPTQAEKLDSWMPSDASDLGESGVNLEGHVGGGVGVSAAAQVVLNRLAAADCVHSNSCNSNDDSGLIIQAVGVIILLDLIVLAIALYAGVEDPYALFYIILTVDLILLGFIAYNFLFAPSLNRPNNVQRPAPIVHPKPNVPNIVN